MLGGVAPAPRFAAPHTYTPRHIAERILTARGAMEGERKQVTVLFADMKGSLELLADRDPEEARALRRVKIVDPSFRNWPALELAVLDNIVPDFPLCNKSFNLSYSGHDL